MVDNIVILCTEGHQRREDRMKNEATERKKLAAGTRTDHQQRMLLCAALTPKLSL